MKFYITKSLPVTSDVRQRQDDPQLRWRYSYSFPNIPTKLQCYRPSDRMKLGKLWRLLRGPLESWTTNVTVTVFKPYVDTYRFRQCSVTVRDDYLEEWSERSRSKITVKIVLQLQTTSHFLTTKDIEITSGGNCQDTNLKYPSELLASTYQRLSGFLSILVTIPDGALGRMEEGEESGIFSFANPTRCILERELLSDVTIVAGDGAKIKAHQVFLALHSPVFQAMFRSDMRESSERLVKIPEMPEDGVRALLKFLYCRDTEDAMNNFVIAFHLYHAGHKYDIKLLENDMNALFLKQRWQWFKDVELLLQLFLFAGNLVPSNEPLKIKTIQVIKMNSKNLETSPTFQKVFQGNAIAMDLFMYALTG